VSYNPDELFRSTAPYYARYRAGYPKEFFTYLGTRLALDGHQTVLDLGCGTGQVALSLAPLVRHIVAIDPEPTMLTEAAKISADRGLTNIAWVQGDSTQLPTLDLPVLNAVTMGASFHWMDRDQVLRDLNALTEPDAAIVVVSGGAPGSSEPPTWAQAITEVRTRYLGTERRAGSTTYTHPPERHAEVLARSAFTNVETAEWTWRIDRTLDEIVGLQFSYSFSAPVLFGDRRSEFEEELRTALNEVNPSHVFKEEIRTESLLATRP
jgi:ubiquinone/menaquinone biosynthesis C-methylase UbiE